MNSQPNNKMNATTQSLVEITGNTYPVKDKLRAIGAKWDAGKKCWLISSRKAQEAAAIVKTAPAKAAFSTRPSAPRPSFSRDFRVCFGCGEELAHGSRCWECGC